MRIRRGEDYLASSTCWVPRAWLEGVLFDRIQLFLPSTLLHKQDMEIRSNEELRLAFIFLVSLLNIFTASGALVVSKEPAKYAQRVYVCLYTIEIKEKRQGKKKNMKRRCPREEPGRYLSERRSHFQSS